MKSYYRQCKKCKKLKPYLTYFLSKEENGRLSEEDRLLCYECYILKGVKEMSIKENDFTCGTCKYDYTKDCEVYKNNGYWLNDYATCDGWTDPDEDCLTEDEKREIIGDRKAHEIMEQEGRIE